MAIFLAHTVLCCNLLCKMPPLRFSATDNLISAAVYRRALMEGNAAMRRSYLGGECAILGAANIEGGSDP